MARLQVNYFFHSFISTVFRLYFPVISVYSCNQFFEYSCDQVLESVAIVLFKLFCVSSFL